MKSSVKVFLKQYPKIVSFILTIVLLFYAIPSIVYAEAIDLITTDEAAGENIADTAEGNPYEYKGEIYEVVELRDEYTKHFRLADGSYVAASYNYPVHTVDENGKFEDIDNRLSSDESTYKNSNARIKFAKKINGSETLFALHEGSTKLELSLVGALKGTVGEVTNLTDNENDTALQKMMSLERLSASVLYRDILDGVDLEYVAHSMNVKENIIVKERKDSYVYSFELKLNGLSASLGEQGDIVITNSKTGEVAYIIPAPVVFDAELEHAPANTAYYTLSDNGNKYTLTVTVSAEWINNEERVFPVTVDPTVVNSYVSVTDTTISYYVDDESIRSSEITLEAHMYEQQSYWKCANLPNLPASAYITNAEFSMYTLYADGTMDGYDPPIVYICNVISDWDSTLTAYDYWNSENPPGMLGNVITDYNIVDTPNTTYVWNVTPLAKKWYEGENYGLGICAGSYGYWITFASNDHTDYAHNPVLTISYMDMKGVESHLSYSSHSAGAGGTGSVNLATGDLNLAIPTLTTTDSLIPYTIAMVYNSSLSSKENVYANTNVAYTSSRTPYGFKLNISECIIEKNFITPSGSYAKRYIYSDSDGTEHTFCPSATDTNIYVDESGLLKTLTVLSDGSITITDDSKITRTFAKMSATPNTTVYGAWYLTKIEDAVGNAVIFTFGNSDPTKPTKVSIKPYGSTAIDMLEIRYYSSGELMMIYNPASRDAVVLRYSDTVGGSISASATRFLRRIDYAKGTSDVTDSNWQSFAASESNCTNITLFASAGYEYDQSGRIISITDGLAEQRLSYTWSGSRVTELAQYAGSTLGQKVTFTYGEGYTDVRSTGNDEEINTTDDIITRYVFDSYGRAASIYSQAVDGTEIYGAITGKYEEQENVKNNLKERTAIGGVSVNYLLNGGFEESSSETSFDHWELSGAVARVQASQSLDGNYSISFNSVNGDSASATQYVRLDAGTYTLSFVYSTFSNSATSGIVKIMSFDGVSMLHSEEIPLSSTGIGSISEFSTTFDIASQTNVRVVIEFTTLAGTTTPPSIEIDNVMLENMIGASDFSLINYGGFDPVSMSAAGVASGLSNYWTSSFASIATEDTDAPFGRALRLTNGSSVKQRIYEADIDDLIASGITGNNSGLTYIVSGFARSDSAVISDKGIFRIRADVIYYGGENADDITVSHYFDFIPAVRGWQFTGGNFSTGYAGEEGDTASYDLIKAIDIYCEYIGHIEGYALFDNISVVNATDNNIERYYYYENGLLAERSGVLYSEYYEYDADRNLTRVANDRGEITDYTYNTLGLVIDIQKYEFVDSNSGKDYKTNLPIYVSSDTIVHHSYGHNSYGLITRYGMYTVDVSSEEYVGDLFYNTKDYEVTPGSKIFGAITHEWYSSDDHVYYYYDENNGRLLATVNSDANTGLCYTYDEIGNLVSVRPATYVSSSSYTAVTGAENVSYTYNENNLLSTITTESTVYTFTYDVFGNSSSISAGNNTLASYEYNENNGKLKKITYGNGYIEEYVYNELESLVEIWYTVNGTRTLAYEYEYTADGQLYKFRDNINEKSTVYRYDTNGRMVAFSEYEESDEYFYFGSTILYNEINKISLVHYMIEYIANGITVNESVTYSYAYNTVGTIQHVNIVSPDSNTMGDYVRYSYDDYDRITKKIYELKNFDITSNYTYASYGEYSSMRVGTYQSIVGNYDQVTYRYTYDDNGNITKIVYSSGEEIRYVYDDLGQLIREDNELIGYTYTYHYDNAGNITSKYQMPIVAEGVLPLEKPSLAKQYGYSTGDWGDLMTSYGGTAITYDAIGNPLSYYNGASYTFTWQGRQMATATKGGVTYSFTYNDEGVRTSKTVNGVTTTYYWNGTQLIAEETSGNITVYVYDTENSPIGMQYHGASYATNVWDVYWYEKNLQGDIVAVYDNTGTRLVTYKYDAWGQHTTHYEASGGNTSVTKNPFRYRGYYYDIDLGLYYNISRYYDSNTGRFINADSLVSTGQGLLGYNMYAYCGNNPVNYVDYTGNSFLTILGLIALAGVLLTNLKADTDMRGDYQAEANEKYNENTININGTNPEGTVNVKITTEDDEINIQIENSYKISNYYEQKAILNTVINAELYTSEYKDVEAMSIEWSAHNFAYMITFVPMINEYLSEKMGKDAHESARSVDIKGLSEDQPLYIIATLGGIIRW